MILFCYDGSDEAQHAIEAAADLLATRAAVVLDVAEVLTGAEMESVVTPGIDIPLLQNLNQDAAHERAEAGVALARRFGFDAVPRGLLAAPAWEGILAVADDIDASVIVVGSRGLTGARRFIEGSVSHALVEHARRPVLVVPR